jgi:hypothetical protein
VVRGRVCQLDTSTSNFRLPRNIIIEKIPLDIEFSKALPLIPLKKKGEGVSRRVERDLTGEMGKTWLGNKKACSSSSGGG